MRARATAHEGLGGCMARLAVRNVACFTAVSADTGPHDTAARSDRTSVGCSAAHAARRPSCASARDGADDVLGATAYDGAGENSADAVNPPLPGSERDPRDSIDVDVDVDARAKEGGNSRDLDDVPVSGAPQASFDALLEASLASASDPRAATPASPSTGPNTLPPQDASSDVTMSAFQEKTPPANASSAAPRPFLRRGDRQRKIADDAKAKRAGEFVSAPSAPRSSTRPAADASAERSSRVISRSAPRSASKKSAREEDELAEFEALERELLAANDANDDEKETRSEASAAAVCPDREKSRRAAGARQAERSCVRYKRVYWPNADFGGTGTDSGCVRIFPDASGCVPDASGF